MAAADDDWKAPAGAVEADQSLQPCGECVQQGYGRLGMRAPEGWWGKSIQGSPPAARKSTDIPQEQHPGLFLVLFLELRAAAPGAPPEATATWELP